MLFRSRQSLISFLLIMTVLSFFTGPLSAQEGRKGPVEMKEFEFDRMSLYAVGWSARGAFAYGTVAPAEGGGRSWQWCILDLIEDRELYVSPQAVLLDGQSPAELWTLHPEWHSQLVRFNIKPAASFQKGGQIFSFGSEHYRMTYTMDRSENPENPGGVTNSIRIDLIRNGNTGKTVYSYTPAPGQSPVEDLILKGCLLSPHEKRAALVTLEKSPGEDGKSRWRYRIIGAHLTVGFTPVKLQGGALAEAVLNGQFYVSRMLLEEGADPSGVDGRGYSALLLAARLGNWRILTLLLDAGAEDDVRDDRGRSALHYAVEAEQREAVRLLLAGGSDPDLKDGEGQSPRLLAGLKGNPVISALF